MVTKPKKIYSYKSKEPVEAIVEEPVVVKPEPSIKPVVEKRKVIGTRYFIAYTGGQKHLSLSGVGRITPGKEYPVRKEIADFLNRSRNWRVRREPIFEK